MPRKSAPGAPYLDQRKDSTYWYICEWNADSGRWRRKSTTATDYGQAQKILADYVLKLARRQPVSDATLVHVMLRYWSRCANKHFSKDIAKRVMALVDEHAGEVRIFNWPTEQQREFIAKISENKGTQRRYWGVIRAAAAWMASDEVKELPSMPALVKIKDKEANSKGKGVKPFSVEELRRLFAVSKLEHEQRLLLLCLVTDARPGAVLDLTWDRINLEHGFADLNVPGRAITNKRRGIVPLSPTVIAYLTDRRSVGPVVQWRGRQTKTFKMAFRRLTKAAGLKGTSYRVRKGVASYLRSQSISVADIKAMLSHSLGGETDEYAHYDPAFMAPVKAAMERLLVLLSPPFLSGLLASHSPVAVPQSSQVVDSVGGRDRDRPCDRFLGEDRLLQGIQELDAANDDSYQLEKTTS